MLNKRTTVALVVVGAAVVASSVTAAAAYGEGMRPNASDVISSEGETFRTVNGVEAEWNSLTDTFPEELPAGVSFPAAPFTFFYETGEEKPIFQDGLAESLLARFWRCAWQDVELSKPKLAADVSKRVDKFAMLPGVSDGLDVDEMEAAIDDAASLAGVDPTQLEFDSECSFYLKEGIFE